MCGRLNVSDDPFVRVLYDMLNITVWTDEPIFKPYIGAAQKVAIVRGTERGRELNHATWWLLLDLTENSFKPSKYTSFNTRYDKLDVPRSAGFTAYRQSRCIIPATGFGESEFKHKKRVHCHDMQSVNSAIAFGGLYREWLHSRTGERVLSCSIITLPPNPKLANIHSKSIPLMLPHNEALFNAWLDPTFTDTSQFTPLLQPNLRHTLAIQQIEKPSGYDLPINTPFVIERDL